MAGGAEAPNIAALPAIARLGTCESARGPDADRHVKLLSQFAVEGSLSGAYSHLVQQPVHHHAVQHHHDRICDARGFAFVDSGAHDMRGVSFAFTAPPGACLECGSPSRIPVCSTTRVKSAVVFSLSTAR
jgi:hypothetical protein